MALNDLNNETEWVEVAEYPFGSFIYAAPMLYYPSTDEFLLIGGKGPHVMGNGPRISNRIDVYSPTSDTWTTKGNLLTKRTHAGVHTIDNGFLVVGGFMNEAGADRVDKYRAEKCVYNGDNDDDEKFVCSYVYDFGRSVPYGETYFVDAAYVPSCLS